MKIIVLNSGSNGNAVYVEAGGTRLLFDAGISGRQAELRLAAYQRDIRDVGALIISHDHSDHVRCMGIYQRKYGIPVHVTPRTCEAALHHCRLGKLHDVRSFEAGDTIEFDHLAVHTVPTPHDGEDGVAFVVDDGSHRVGILTDLGHVFEGLPDVISSLDAVLIESNYDPQMLRDGYYPEFLKERIRGLGGHLSNLEAARLIAEAAGPRLRWLCLAHLSDENNLPQLARDTHQRIVGDRLPIHVASRYEPTGPFDV